MKDGWVGGGGMRVREQPVVGFFISIYFLVYLVRNEKLKKIVDAFTHHFRFKNKSYFLGVFRENHTNGCPDLKNKDRSLLL